MPMTASFRTPSLLLSILCFAFCVPKASAQDCRRQKALMAGSRILTHQIHATMAYGQFKQLTTRYNQLGRQKLWLEGLVKKHKKKAKKKAELALTELLKLETSLKKHFDAYKETALQENALALSIIDHWEAYYAQCKSKWFPKGDSKEVIKKERQRLHKEMKEITTKMVKAYRQPVTARTQIGKYQLALRELQQQAMVLSLAPTARNIQTTRKQLETSRAEMKAAKLKE